MLSNIYILGAPGAGKTTLAKNLSKAFDLPFYTIDDFVPLVYNSKKINRPMLDNEINDALIMLFLKAESNKGIFEFAHHDYQLLISNSMIPSYKYSLKIIIQPDIQTCIKRNMSRTQSVPLAYLKRVWMSAKILISKVERENEINYFIIKTDQHTNQLNKLINNLLINKD